MGLTHRSGGRTRRSSTEQRAAISHDLKRVLRSDGTFWLNISDTYCGTGKPETVSVPTAGAGRILGRLKFLT